MCEGDEAANEGFMDTTETDGTIPRVVLMKSGTDYDPHEAFLRVW